MKPIPTTLSCICLLLSLSVVSHAKGWRGIVPLHSTREDVVKLLGEPPPPPADGTRFYTLNKGRSIYPLDEGEIYIVFSGGVEAYHECAKQLPVDTVLLIQFSPKVKLRLADLQVEEKRLRKFDPSSPPDIGYEGLIDDEEGVVIRAFRGAIYEVNYIAASKDRHLCPSYYERPEKFVSILVDFAPGAEKFDEYGALPRREEEARLANFANLLEQRPSAQGYVVAYAGRRARVGEALAMANRARAYLEKELKMAEGRIMVVDGGYREKQAVELYAVPVGAIPPVPAPTVNPAEVQIIKGSVKPGSRRRRSRP